MKLHQVFVYVCMRERKREHQFLQVALHQYDTATLCVRERGRERKGERVLFLSLLLP